MKRIIKFTIYKIVEIAGAFIVWWGLSWWGNLICTVIVLDYNPEVWLQRWIFAPLLGLIIIVGILSIGFGVYNWIKWNWEKSGK